MDCVRSLGTGIPQAVEDRIGSGGIAGDESDACAYASQCFDGDKADSERGAGDYDDSSERGRYEWTVEQRPGKFCGVGCKFYA